MASSLPLNESQVSYDEAKNEMKKLRKVDLFPKWINKSIAVSAIGCKSDSAQAFKLNYFLSHECLFKASKSTE